MLPEEIVLKKQDAGGKHGKEEICNPRRHHCTIRKDSMPWRMNIASMQR
jgi:hypothetical protein